MNVREATPADIPAFSSFIARALAGVGITPPFGLTVLRSWWREGRWRFAIVEDQGVILTGLLTLPVETDTWARACEIHFLLTNPALPPTDRLLPFDTLSLWLCNRLQSESVGVVFGRQRPDLATHLRDHLGAEVVNIDLSRSDEQSTFLWGRTDEIARSILARHPEWQL